MAADEHIALVRDRSAALADISVRQLDQWTRSGIVDASIDRQVTGGRRVRLYGFDDLLQLLVAAELRRRGMSLQHIRRVVDHLRRRGYPAPLRQLSFATFGQEIYFQHSDGSWEGDLRPDQVVLHQVIHLDLLRTRIRSATDRPASNAGRVERRRGRVGAKPVIAGTRVSVDVVRRYVDHGCTDEEIVAALPILTATDVRAVRTAAGQ